MRGAPSERPKVRCSRRALVGGAPGFEGAFRGDYGWPQSNSSVRRDMHRLTPGPEDAAGRRARHRDTAISGLIAAAAVLALVLTTNERGLRPILVVTCVAGGIANAVLDARRAGWRWAGAWQHLLFTAVATGVVYVIAWASGY
jgi:hypothetical protein